MIHKQRLFLRSLLKHATPLALLLLPAGSSKRRAIPKDALIRDPRGDNTILPLEYGGLGLFSIADQASKASITPALA